MAKKNTNNKLLWYAITYGIDLWVFKQVFANSNYDYAVYVDCYKDVSRLLIKKEQFYELRELMQNYLKETK